MKLQRVHFAKNMRWMLVAMSENQAGALQKALAENRVLQIVCCLLKVVNAVLLGLQACAQPFELRKDVPDPMRLFATLAKLLNDLLVDHALRLDKMRKGLGRVDGINRDALIGDHDGLLSVLLLGAPPLPRGHGILVDPQPSLTRPC
jgi:hypothetical protein